MNREWKSVIAMTAGVVVIAVGVGVNAQNRDMSEVEIKTEKLTDDLFMLTGMGGNIGLSVGTDGAMLIDDQFAPLSDKIKAAVGKVTDRPIRLIVNTHYHGDHVGGNETFGKAGAVIIAQDNVRTRLAGPMVRGRDTIPASPAAGLPLVTFARDLTLHLNGREIQILHMPHAHTDGDAVISSRARTSCTGRHVLQWALSAHRSRRRRLDRRHDRGDGSGDRATDDKTKIIPGHGPLGDRARCARSTTCWSARATRCEAGCRGEESRRALAAKPTAKWTRRGGRAS
jgi:glyoxylase-like metal-dependent hydrolase (beta-lactamase superfamily II)